MILYKYLSPSRVHVVENLKIRFTQAPYLNDPYETNPAITGWDISDEDWKKISEIEAKRSGLDLKQFEKLNDKKYRDEAFPDALLLLKFMMQHSSGILSLSETYDNAIMWAHYCQNHEGFVVGLRTDHAFFHTTRREFTVNNAHKMVYSDKRPNYTLEKLTMRDMFFTKSNEWSYEKEWRLLKNIESADSVTNEIALFNIPPEVVESVYLGAACSPETEDKLMRSIKKHKLSIEIRKMLLNSETYAIDDWSYDDWLELKKSLVGSPALRAMEDLRHYLYDKYKKP